MGLDELVRRIEDPETPGREREAAVADLVERCRKDAELRERYLLRFVTLLADDSPVVRGWAIVGVVLGDEQMDHLQRIVRLLEDPSPGVRLQALHALMPLGRENLAGHFAERLEDRDRLVRLTAAVALAELRDVRATDELISGAEKRRTRLEALAALRHLLPALEGAKREAVLELAGRILGSFWSSRFDKLEAAGILAAAGDDSAKRFLLERAQRGKLERPMAIERIGEYRVEGAEEYLKQVAADERDPFRGAALRALASFGSEEAFDRCSAVLRSEKEDPDLRCDAAEGLLLFGGDRAEEELRWATAHAGNEMVRRIAERCLSLFGRPADEMRRYLPLSGDEVI